MPAEPVPVTPPKHPLPALTSFELRDYRRELERAIKGISPGAPVQAALRAKLNAVLASRTTGPRWLPVREHDMTTLTLAELECAWRELAASLALARPGSPVCVPIQAQLTAIDAELARRVATRPDESPRSPKP